MAKSIKEGMLYKVLDHRLKTPGYATEGSAGIDLCAMNFDGMRMAGRATVVPGGEFTLGTGLAVHIGSFSTGLVGMVMPRSSLGKRGLALRNTVGVIDEDYQGEILLLCRNASKHVLFIDPGERVAQMVVLPVFQPKLVETAEFAATERGAGGFGSTGQ